MERIVNGDYADPNSTRDIMGITPDEFAVLIDVLREKYASIEMVLKLDEENRKLFCTKIFDVMEIEVSTESYDKKLKYFIAKLENQHVIVENFLNDINQPYPDAFYFPGD